MSNMHAASNFVQPGISTVLLVVPEDKITIHRMTIHLYHL